MQLFRSKYLDGRFLQNFGTNITFTKRMTARQDFPQSGRAFSSWKFKCFKWLALVRKVKVSRTCPREKPDSSGKHTRTELASAPDSAWWLTVWRISSIFYWFHPFLSNSIQDQSTFAFWAGRPCRICQSTVRCPSPPWWKKIMILSHFFGIGGIFKC